MYYSVICRCHPSIGRSSSVVIVWILRRKWHPIVERNHGTEEIWKRLNICNARGNMTSLVINSTLTATMAAVTATAAIMATMAASMAILRDSFRLQGLQLKFRNFALTAAGPHTWPLTVTFLRFFLTALTTRIVNTRSKLNWECYRFATMAATSAATATATATAVMTNMRTSEATATIATSTKT